MEDEASKVRLVRCPKCGNVLSEQPNFSVYQCGGCGTVLRAKNKGVTEEGLSKVSDDEKERGIITINSGNEGEYDGNDGVRMNEKNPVGSNGGSISRTEENEVLEIDQGRKVDYMQNLKGPIDNYPGGNEHEFEDTRYPVRSLRSRSIENDWTSRGPDGGPRNFSKYPYVNEGPSNYDRYNGRPSFHENMDGFARVANLEKDRAELLKKLDELKDQISKSGDLPEKPTGPPTPPPPPRTRGYMDPHDSYHPRNFINEHPGLGPGQGYNRPYYPQMTRRPTREPPVHYPRQTYHENTPEYYMNYDQDPFISHPPGNVHHHHHPTCTCSYCYIQPRASRNSHPGTVSYHHLNSYPSDISYRERQVLTRTPNDLDSEAGGFNRHRPIITNARARTSAHARVCRPISGGAPFIACSHCFESLKIPRKLRFVAKSDRQMRCGACSATLSFEYGSQGTVLAISHVSEDENENLQDWAENDESNLESIDPNLKSSKEPKLDSSELQNRQYPRFSSSSFSEDEQSPDSVIVREDLQEDASLPLPNHQSPENTENRYENNYKIKNGDGERFIHEKITSRQASVKDTAIETEMDSEFPNSGVSQDSTEVSKGGSRINKFTNIFKRNNKDLSKPSPSMENGKSNVFINEHPISDRILKKVEKLTGLVQPGEYWYDYRAGFWGVMGYPCLGIIPPKIEEFNFPLPEDCGNGNTKVYVNGRELHQSDLDLLSSRGLPLTRHKSYLVEMSGKVVDEHTGEELDNLGKLAPTVERAGHGFGMKVPKSLQAQ